MDIVHCPSCGSGSVEKNSSSFEYGRSTRWSCEECGWYYKKGSGIGTGTGNSGVHPRDAGPSGSQTTLTEVGVWCPDCQTCIAGDHDCSVSGALEAVGDPAPQRDVIDELDRWHIHPLDVLVEAVRDGECYLTEVAYYVTADESAADAFDEQVVHEIEQSDNYEQYGKDTGYVSHSKLEQRMDIDTKAEKQYLRRRLDRLRRDGRIVRASVGYKVSE